MTTTTTASEPQHLRALARANEVRLARAELKRRVHDGELTVADVILDVPREADRMTVADLLTSQRRWGHTRCRKLLLGIPVSETKTIGSMTDRQRRAVAVAVTGQAAAEAAAVRPRALDGALACGASAQLSV